MSGIGVHRIEISLKSEFNDPVAFSTAALLRATGAHSINRVKTSRIYEISGAFTIAQIHRMSRELLGDPVTEESRILPNPLPASNGGPLWRIEIRLKPTVSDPEADTIREAIAEMGLPLPDSIRVLSIFKIDSKCPKPQIETAVSRGLANPIIHLFSVTASS